MLDIYDLTKSELKLELINITETGYESLWAGIYYINSTIYVNLQDTFNIQKVAISGFNLADLLKDFLIDFDTDNAFKYGNKATSSSTNEAFVAEESFTSGDVDFSNKDLALALLINKDRLTIAIGDILFDTVLEYIPEEFAWLRHQRFVLRRNNGSLKIDLDTSESLILELSRGALA